MNRPISFFAAILYVLATQACSTSGGTELGTHGSPAEPTRENSAPGTGAKPSAFVPAIIGVPTDPEPDRSYRIGPGDELQIEVFQVDDLATKTVVNERGLIVMPLIGDVKVAGLTPVEAEETIASRLNERYLNNPKVSVFVAASSAHGITVSGHVKNPGVFPLTRRTTLMQIITMAGGVDNVGKKDQVLVFRKQENGRINAYVVNLAAIEEGELADPVMIGDDRIVVPKSEIAELVNTAKGVLTGSALRAALAF